MVEIRCIIIVMHEMLLGRAIVSLLEQEIGDRLAGCIEQYPGGQISFQQRLVASEIKDPSRTLLVLHSELWNDPGQATEIDKLEFTGVRCVQISNRSHSSRPEFVIRNKNVSAFVDTIDPPESLVKAVVFASRGQAYISKTRLKNMPDNATAQLSIQEQRALAYVCYSAKEAAEALGVGEKTIHTYFKRVRTKLSIPTTAHLIGWCLSNGVATLPLRVSEFEEDVADVIN